MSAPEPAMEAAIKTAENARGGLLVIAKKYLPDTTTAGILKVCPCCQKSILKPFFKKHEDKWAWWCQHESCRVSFKNLNPPKGSDEPVGWDTLGFIMEFEGCDRSKAVDILLKTTNTPNPRDEYRDKEEKLKSGKAESKTKKKKKDTPPPAPTPAEEEDNIPGLPPITDHSALATPTNVTPFTKPPEESESPPPVDTPPQVWNRIHQLLTLTPTDSSKLSKVRGFSKETIDKVGYKSSNQNNRMLLAPLLDEFPPGLLLKLGIASEDKDNDNKLKINAQLCGYGIIKRGETADKDEWGGTDPILIPYRGKDGNMTMIRPHKGGLSGKNYMRRHGFELGFRSENTRSQLYTNCVFEDRPSAWRDMAVLTEGEFKADALGQCGIPAAAVPGIQMPRNNPFFKAMVERFRVAGVKHIIVCFDNEDKSHKPDPWDRHDAKVYAIYASHALRVAGFITEMLTLPDEWRDKDGKADWDGALARFGKGAAGKFSAALKKAKRYYPQTEFFGGNEEARIVHCKVTRLIHDPQILSGGDSEENLAHLIHKTPAEWRTPSPYIDPATGRGAMLPPIAAHELAKELIETRGCYYVRKKPREEVLPRWYALSTKIREEMQAANPDDLKKIAGLEAALAAVNHIIEGRPKILTDFTISCDFQLRSKDGEIQRLFKFKNKHGQVSDNIVVPSSAVAGAMRFREFVMSKGNFNPKIGDSELQELMQDIGTMSAWREIRELEMLGHDPDSGLWILGDCAFTKDGEVLFADSHDIIWHEGIGYRIDPDDMKHFVHQTPPKFFEKLGLSPSEAFREITASPEAVAAETREVARIFFQQDADFLSSFGGMAGMLCQGNYVSYAIAPELLQKYKGQAGQWIHGRGGAGKTEMARFILMSWGYSADFMTQVSGGGTTAVSIDRFLAQYSNIPVNIDEFREKEEDATRSGTLRACFGRQSKTKGRMDSSNRTRSVQPKTPPIVTGEGVTGDSATLTRYVEMVLAKDRRLGTPEQQVKRYNRMCRDQYQYHRIMRYVMMNRAEIAAEAMPILDEFLHSKDAIAQIAVDRVRLVYGTSYACFTAIWNRLLPFLLEGNQTAENPISKPDLVLVKEHMETFREDTITYARNANADVASINFVIKFWQNVVTSLGSNQTMKRFIRFERCKIDEKNRITPMAGNLDVDGIVRCVIVRDAELYAEYEKEMAQRRQSTDLSYEGIRSEIRRENYWLPAPTNLQNKTHRLSIWGDGEGQKRCWVLRYDKMEHALQQVFADQFESNISDEQEEIGF